jgi:hypothetical protein
MVYNLKICIIGCDDNLKGIQFCQILHTVAYNLIPMVHDSVMASYLQQEGSDTLPPPPPEQGLTKASNFSKQPIACMYFICRTHV